MSDLPHPVDEGLITLALAKRRIVQRFAADGLDDDERAVLALLDGGITPIGRYRARERAMTYWLRGGDITSRYGTQLANEAGVRITRLEDTRSEQSARVVRLDDRRTDPHDAA